MRSPAYKHSEDRHEPYATGNWTGWVDSSLLNSASREWIGDPGRFFESNVVLWFKRGRNQLAEVRWPQEKGGAVQTQVAAPATVVLKEYRVNGIIGALRGISGAMRHSSKAQRAADRAFALLERGIRTPRPLWLALPKSGGLRASSYLAVETAPPHARLRELLKQLRNDRKQVEVHLGLRLEIPLFLQILASYVRRMHNAGIWHRDFSGGNLLIPLDWQVNGRAPEKGPESANPAALIDTSAFILIDVNRARLFTPGALTISQRLQDLERISLPETLRKDFYRAYAEANPELAAAEAKYLRWARRYRRLREARNPLERLARRIFGYWLRMP